MVVHVPARAILFDCDGVLVDSKDSGNRSWTTWAERYGLDPATVLDGVHGRRSRETVAKFLAETDRPTALEAIDRLEIADAVGTRPIAGARELLIQLPRNWAVVTSATDPLLRARVGAAGLPRPLVVVTAEDVSVGKPDPQGYLLAARRLGVAASECVVLEDSLTGIKAGRAAGVRYVLGVGAEALDSDADAVVTDLAGLSWDGSGLVIADSALLRG
ncbi:HAD-IA family hydrolase [Jatrophihabitans telluris]|uniref:HAD-IA family hydrolase n=1 Tax=Jatrophihabitans telluris TaxID=2038343 RepID=A0ABY4R0R4_9ACTN|nr:HAD-IA family hydrolase [Jatrophihabitans telluris]UQX89434.1 HAD-IA family hydrolase [Jatrophihabitans telluris]